MAVRMAITHINYPDRGLDEAGFDKIKTALIQRIDDQPEEAYTPNLFAFRLTAGVIRVDCANSDTQAPGQARRRPDGGTDGRGQGILTESQRSGTREGSEASVGSAQGISASSNRAIAPISTRSTPGATLEARSLVS